MSLIPIQKYYFNGGVYSNMLTFVHKKTAEIVWLSTQFGGVAITVISGCARILRRLWPLLSPFFCAMSGVFPKIIEKVYGPIRNFVPLRPTFRPNSKVRIFVPINFSIFSKIFSTDFPEIRDCQQSTADHKTVSNQSCNINYCNLRIRWRWCPHKCSKVAYVCRQFQWLTDEFLPKHTPLYTSVNNRLYLSISFCWLNCHG